jgi:glycosyltransferase involved in cell wall biosynthesis
VKVGVLAYEMEGERTGVGRYLEGLLSGLAEHDAPHRWHLFFKGDPFDHPLWDGDGDRFVPVFDGRPGARPILWEQTRLPRLIRRAGLDFLFSPAYSLPRGFRGPSMLVVHDLSFERLPEEFDLKERWRRRLLARRSAHRASRVLADTGAVARELAATYSLPAHKIGVVPLGIDPRVLGEPADDARQLARVGVEPPYLLYLGSILPRRRVDLVIGAFARVAARRPGLRLVLAGGNRLRRRRELDRWIAESGCGERIVRVGYVAEEALGALYRGAELTFYLSEYEGYGLPPLESLAAGTPALVGPGLALDELWPDYPYRVPRLELAAVADVTLGALDGADARRRIGDEGRERMARLTWKCSAEHFLAEMERAVADSRDA